MSLQTDGTWKGAVWAATVWAAGVWYEPATTVTTQPHGGGGGKHGGDWYRHYKHPGEKKYRPIADEIREMYEAMVEIAPPIELTKIHAVVAEYVEKPTTDYARLPEQVIDWATLANDLEQVYALARIYDRILQDEEEAAFMLLM